MVIMVVAGVVGIGEATGAGVVDIVDAGGNVLGIVAGGGRS